MMIASRTKAMLGFLLLTLGTGLPHASAYQGFGPGPMPGSKPEQDPTASERIETATKALEALSNRQRSGEGDAKIEETLRWQRRLHEAKRDAGQPSSESAQPYIEALKAAEALALSLFKAGKATSLDVLEAKYARLEAEKRLHPTPSPQPMAGAMGGGAGGGFEGGAMGGATEPQPRRLHKAYPADAERNKEIEQKLETRLAMNFGSEAPFEDVLKYIKANVPKVKTEKSIPIYVDPRGLQEADKTLTSTVTIDLEDVPLRTTLRLVLHQIDLDYRVRDGMIYISDRAGLDEEDEEAENERINAQVTEARIRAVASGMVGGMTPGGMGGMGGGGIGGGLGGMGGAGGGMR